MSETKTDNRKNGRNKPLEIFVSPAGVADCNADFAADEEFWAAVDRFIEDGNNKVNKGFFNYTMHTEFITDIILEQMK